MNRMEIDPRTRHFAAQVLYQIFPERFAIGGGLSSAQKLAHPAYALPGVIRRDWDERATAQDAGHQFFGGDLDGITDRLDHLEQLGVTGVYLTPIFEAPSNHKYDATDLHTVDAMFGGDAALQRLIAALHARGMELTLDAVLNHVSPRHPWFQAALAGHADYRDWFSFKADGSYLCWQDHAHMPELNLDHPGVRDALYRRPDSVIQAGLARGVDHWRFDVAQDLGMGLAQDLARCVHARFPQAGLVGELNGFAGAWFQAGGGYTGMMNYWHRTALLAWLSGEIGARQLHHALGDARQAYGLAGLLCSWNILASHDTPRLITALGDPSRARLAQLLQFTLPGVPLIYYGEEVGMRGGQDPDCRQPMRWNPALQDLEQLRWTRQLVALRRSQPALQWGELQLLGERLDGNVLAFLRDTGVPGEALLVLVNAGLEPLHATLLLPHSHWYDGVPLRDLLGGAPDLKVQAGSVRLQLAAGHAAVYRAFEPLERFTHFKPRNR